MSNPIFVVPHIPGRWKNAPSLSSDDYAYASLFENEFGELLLFVVTKDDHAAYLHHSDTEDQIFKIEEKNGELRSWCEKVKSGIVLHHEERLWLAACWGSSRHARTRHLRTKANAANRPTENA